MTLERFDLNYRHVAAVLWLVVLVCGLSLKIEMRRAIINMVRAMLERTLLSVLIGAIVWSVLMLSAAVVVGRLLGLWSTIPLVTGLYWFLISGIPLLMTSFTEDPVAYGKRLGEACGISAVFVAFISVSTFSLPEEVFIVLFAELLGILYAASLMSEDTGKRMRRLFPTVPILFYLVIVLGSMLAGKVSVVNVFQAFLLPVILTGTLQPYIKYVRFMERYEGRGGAGLEAMGLIRGLRRGLAFHRRICTALSPGFIDMGGDATSFSYPEGEEVCSERPSNLMAHKYGM